jgi:hypothetical protein
MKEETVKGIINFVEARRKETGGYAATPCLPATVEDTYNALRIIETLGDTPGHFYRQDTALKEYLSRMAETDWVTARTTFHVLYACRLAGVRVDESRTMTLVERRMRAPFDLSERYYCARIMKEVLGAADNAVMKITGDYVPADWRTAAELWMILYLADRKRIYRIPQRRDLITWLQACQNDDGGFGFLPGTTSFIENCHTCLRVLALLGAKPLDIDDARAFILACRTGSGGFARVQGATAFLDATWHAVASRSLPAL